MASIVRFRFFRPTPLAAAVLALAGAARAQDAAPVQTVQVGSQISGRVKEVLKLINDPVKKGDVLAILES